MMLHEPLVRRIEQPGSTPAVTYEAACSCGWENSEPVVRRLDVGNVGGGLDHLPWPESDLVLTEVTTGALAQGMVLVDGNPCLFQCGTRAAFRLGCSGLGCG